MVQQVDTMIVMCDGGDHPNGARCQYCGIRHKNWGVFLRCRAQSLQATHGVCPVCQGSAVVPPSYGRRRPTTFSPAPALCARCGDSGANLTRALRRTELPDIIFTEEYDEYHMAEAQAWSAHEDPAVRKAYAEMQKDQAMMRQGCADLARSLQEKGNR